MSLPVTRAFPWIWVTVALYGQHEEPPIVLRSETRAVQIDVVVKDRAGEPIRDLRREDFSVLDDGKPRAVQIFSPFFSIESKPSVSGIAGVSGAHTGRVTVIVLDGLNTEFQDQSYARGEAVKAVQRMELDESIAILTPDLNFQNFTRSRERLLAAINGFRPNIPPYPMRQRVQVTLAAFRTLADRMSGAPGRKSIVWITGGFPQIRAYQGAIQRALNKINDSNVAIYPIDARGLTVGSGMRNIQMMEQFAESTGGEAYYNRNDVAVAIEEAIKDSKSTYAVGFYLGDKDRDHRFHELKVEVDRHDAVVPYRRGYSSAATSPDASVEDHRRF